MSSTKPNFGQRPLPRHPSTVQPSTPKPSPTIILLHRSSDLGQPSSPCFPVNRQPSNRHPLNPPQPSYCYTGQPSSPCFPVNRQPSNRHPLNPPQPSYCYTGQPSSPCFPVIRQPSSVNPKILPNHHTVTPVTGHRS
jgi:hypothetical protein